MLAHPRPCRRDQGGFALIAGLVLWMLVCGVTLVALLGMTLTGSRTSAAQAVDSRQSRAADSALEAAVNQIRMDGSGAIGAPSSADDGTCQTGLGSSGSGLDYADEVGTSVTVTAECLRSPQLTPRTDSGENPNAAKQLDVVGGSYRSASDLPDTVRWRTDCAGAADNNCYPWRLGIGGPNYLAQKSAIEAQSPTFLHTSDPAVASGSSTLEVLLASLPAPTPGSSGCAPRLIGPRHADGTGAQTCRLTTWRTTPWMLNSSLSSTTTGSASGLSPRRTMRRTPLRFST